MIEQPKRITPDTVSRCHRSSAAHAMIEIITPERFVRMGGASRVAEDEAGVLWRKLWGYRGVTIGSWTAVEVERHA
jgi:hypothetical protein